MRIVAAVMVLALVTVLAAGCGEDPTENAITTDELKRRRSELAAKRKANEKTKQKVAKQAPAATPEQGKSNLKDAFASGGDEYFYDPRDKRDPFRSFLFAAQDEEEKVDAGPLADYELSQLSVVAIVWDANSPRALVSDPRGRTHILGEGSAVGKNQGRVIHIGDNLVLVKETYVDYAGEESTNDVELRIRSSQGG